MRESLEASSLRYATLRALQEFTQTFPAWIFGYVTSHWETIRGNHSGTRGL
jgi:hypothetical protein